MNVYFYTFEFIVLPEKNGRKIISKMNEQKGNSQI